MAELPMADAEDMGASGVIGSDGLSDIGKWLAEAVCGEHSAVFCGTHEWLTEVKTAIPGR